MTFRFNTRATVWAAALLAGLWMTSCKQDEVEPDSTNPASDNQAVNDWIYENLKEVYYWNDKIPANPNKSLAPTDFFESLLYRFDATLRPDGDRFSWIQENADELTASLSGESKSTGMEFTLGRRSSGSDDVIAQVLYVLPGTPAAEAGIKRGDIIYQVNGQRLTLNNYGSLLFDRDSYVFGLAKVEGSALVDTDQTKTVGAKVLQEDPVYLDSVYVRNGKTIGYLVYNQFIPSPNGSTNQAFDRKIDQIFSDFKNQGINELVIDFRYNPGGYVSSATNLASLIGKGIDNSKVFYRQEYNKNIMAEIEAENQTASLVTRFRNKAENVGGNLQRVFILTSRRTASASELIINGLKPYMPVVLIGATTTGKNVGSITRKDETGKIKWGMQPIVSKSFNSLGQSDYTAGFVPNAEINETLTSRQIQLGDLRDPLLNEAIFQMTGDRNVRRGVPTGARFDEVGSSLERKAGGSNMFMENVQLPQ